MICLAVVLEGPEAAVVLEDAENKRALKEIEDKILYLLKNSEGNILDDEVLIETLKDSKIKSVKIEKKQKIAAKTFAIIAKTRIGYKPLAFHGSRLFFCIADLSVIDPMYQYSMEWYQALFVDAMERRGCPNPEQLPSSKMLTTSCIKCVIVVCVDKLFSALLTVKIMSGQGKLTRLI